MHYSAIAERWFKWSETARFELQVTQFSISNGLKRPPKTRSRAIFPAVPGGARPVWIYEASLSPTGVG